MARKQLGVTPSVDADAATKKYVDDAVAAGGGGGGTGVSINDLTLLDRYTVVSTDVSPVVDVSVDATRKMTHIDEATVHTAWTAGMTCFLTRRLFVP